MQLDNLILNAQKHSRDMAQIPRLIQADRAKFARREISSIVHDNLLLSRINVCEAILKSHKVNPYNTVDELIGDIQILMVNANDELRAVNGHYKIDFKLEDLIHGEL